MLESMMFMRNVPLKTPINSDKTTSLVINAKTIATTGGMSVQKPKISAFFFATSGSTASAKIGKSDKNKIFFIKNSFLFFVGLIKFSAPCAVGRYLRHKFS